MKALTPRFIWSLLAAGSFALVAANFILTAWLDLHPCHLCIFQRLLFMILVVLSGLAAWLSPRPASRWIGALNLPVAAGGMAVATYQSWLQVQPPGSISCLAGEPSLIEKLVEWLGQRLPEWFLATGFCEQTELNIMGLSLANWALIAFIACFIAAAWALVGIRNTTRR